MRNQATLNLRSSWEQRRCEPLHGADLCQCGPCMKLKRGVTGDEVILLITVIILSTQCCGYEKLLHSQYRERERMVATGSPCSLCYQDCRRDSKHEKTAPIQICRYVCSFDCSTSESAMLVLWSSVTALEQRSGVEVLDNEKWQHKTSKCQAIALAVVMIPIKIMLGKQDP